MPANLPAKLTRTNPTGGCHGSPWAQRIEPGTVVPCPKAHGPGLFPREPWGLAQGPEAHGPLLGNTVWERLRRGIFPYYSLGMSQMAPKYSGTVRGSRRAMLVIISHYCM